MMTMLDCLLLTDQAQSWIKLPQAPGPGDKVVAGGQVWKVDHTVYVEREQTLLIYADGASEPFNDPRA